MPTIADYERWKAGRQQNGVAAANVVLGSVNEAPDEVAGDLNLASEFGKVTGNPVPPRPLVKEYRSTFQATIERERNNTILATSPRLTEWLRNPENAAISRDDLPNLSFWEKLGAQVREVPRAVPGGAVSAGGTAMEGVGQLMSAAPRDPADRRPISEAIASAGKKTPEEIAALRKEIFQQGAVNPTIAQSVLSEVLAGDLTPDEAMQALEPAIAHLLGAGGRALQSGGQAAQEVAPGILPAAPGMEDSFGREVGAGLGSMLTILGIGILTGGAGAFAAGGLAGAGEAASRARQAGQDEDMQTVAALWGIFPGLTEAIPIERLLANPAITRGLASILRSIGRQAAVEGGQEAVQGILQNLIAQNLYAPDQSATEGVLRAFSTGGVVGGIVEAGRIGLNAALPGRLRRAQEAAAKAPATVETLQGVSTQAAQSATRNRMADRFREYVARATEGGPVENVYIPAEQFSGYFQSIGVDPYEIADSLDGVSADDLRMAEASGGSLQIPLATYAAKMAGSEHDAFLMENMAFDPDDMTASEAMAFNERSQEAVEAAWDEAEAARVRAEEARSLDEKIYDAVVSQLRAAGRSTDVATTEAVPLQAFYRTQAARAGMTPEAFLEMYPLPQVQGEIPTGMQLRDVDELNRTLAELRARKAPKADTRMSLLEFIDQHGGINDPGGELRSRGAETVKRGKGKKTLRLARGAMDGVKSFFGSDGKRFGIDDVAQAAIEAGYLADDPDVLEYQEALREGRQTPALANALMAAIDRELGGAPEFSGESSVDVEREEALDQIEEYLSRLSVSLDDDDAAIKAAIERDQEEGRRYGQFGGSMSNAFNVDMWSRADEMERAGATRQEIWDETGFFRGPDKKWRFEISDADATLKMEAFKPGALEGVTLAGDTLENLLTHDRLFQAYPHLRRIRAALIISPSASGDRGSWDGEAIQVTARDEEAVRSVLLHEIAHAIQQHEGFDGGSNLDAGELYAGEKVEGIRARLAGLNEEWEAAAAESQREKLAGIEEQIEGYQRALVRAAQFEYYRRNLGETEARNVQERDRLAREGNELATDGPWWTQDVPDDQVIVARTLRHGDSFEALSLGDESSLAPRRGGYLFQSGDVRGARGSIQFPAAGVGNGDTIIRLFQTANLSTTLHESGHYFLTVTQDMARRGIGTASDDMATVQGWWRANAEEVAKDGMRVMPDVTITADDVIAALDNGGTGDMMKDAAIDVGMQEQWARGFEAYVMEGKAPSIDLRGVFEKMRAWLISIYRHVRGLDVNLSDDVRAVFDRMLATDAEIATARDSVGDVGPIFTSPEAMGVTPDEYAAFLKLRDQAEDEAKATLLKEAMAPVRRAQEQWFKDERAKAREDVAREINALPYFRAIEWMGNRRWLGDDQPDEMPDIRLSKQILVDRYGEGVLKTLPRGKFTVYAVEGGIDPDDAAGWFGFDSGDEMIRAMERAPKRNEAIDADTDQVMRERHGDILNDGSIQAAAVEAIHNDNRGDFIAAELKALAAIGGSSAGLTRKEARASARTAIARMRVRDAMASGRFLAAERKAADEASRLAASIWRDSAKGRVQAAAEAAAGNEPVAAAPGREQIDRLIELKRRQLLNHALYMEARKVADEVEAAESLVAKLGKKPMRQRIAGAGRRENASIDYLAAIDEILERYDFRRMTGPAEQRRGALAAFVEGMKAAGRENELAIPESVLADAARKPYKTIPVEEMRGVVDSLKNLQHVALRWNRLIDAKNKRDLDMVVADILGAFDENVPSRPPARVGSKAESRRAGVRQYLDLVLNAGTLLREVDGFKNLGPAYRNIKSPIDDAMTRLIERKEKAATDLDALYAVYSKEERRRMAVREHMPDLGYSLSKWERIAIALNAGNAGNRQRLTDQRTRGALTDDQLNAVLATLDERDADFVQSVWDYVGSFRTDIAARERRATGTEPAWVEPTPVTIAGKVLPGGYYPIKSDPRLSALARDDQANDIANSLQAGRFGKAQTRNGHLKERAQASGRSVELDMSVLHRHVNQVIYDLELSEAVSNSWRILQNGQIRSAFIDAGKQVDFDALETWLKDVAEGEIRASDWLNRASRTLKSNFTAAKLALNLGTVLVQTTGLAQTAVVVGKRDMVRGIQASFRRGVGDEIAAKSAFMRTRQTTFNKDIFDFYDDPKMGPVASRWGEFKSNRLGPLSFWLMTKVQWYTVDIPTWLAGYQQGLRDFDNNEDRAIAHADSIVKRAQASGLFSDRSAVERGSVSSKTRQNDVIRLFTALGSYMFAKFNVAYERTAQARRVLADEGASQRSVQEALSWTIDMAFLFTIEAVMITAMKGFLHDLAGGGDDDEKEDEGWAAFLAAETAFSVMGTMPFIRDLAGPLQGFGSGGAYGAITKDVVGPLLQGRQGEIDAALVKSIINATGLATGIPATQINRAVDAAWRQAEGEEVSPMEYLLGRQR